MFRAAILSTALLSTPAFANSYYHAQPETAPQRTQLVVRDNVWRCAEQGCTSARGGSRPAVVCQALAREVGRLRSFAVEGRPLEAAALESCNARAR